MNGTEADSARAFACAFAADYLSWDEEAPQHRGVVLAGYLHDLPPASVAWAGWDGHGRQRVDMVVPGVPVGLPQGLVMVPVAVQVTSFAATGAPQWAHSLPEMRSANRQSAPPFVPSTAPDPTDPGWVPHGQEWLQLDVLVRLHDGQLSIAPATIDPPIRIS